MQVLTFNHKRAAGLHQEPPLHSWFSAVHLKTLESLPSYLVSASYTTILSISPFSCRRYDWTDEASIAELTDGMLSKHEGNTTITFTKERKTETSLFLKCLQWRCSCTIAFKNYLLSFTQSKSHHSEGGTVPRLCVKDKKLKKHIQWDVNYSRLSAPSELTYQCQGGCEPTTLEGLLQRAPSRPCYLGTKAKPQSILNATFAHTL